MFRNKKIKRKFMGLKYTKINPQKYRNYPFIEFIKKRLRNKGSGSRRQNPASYMVNNIVYFLLITAAPPRTAVTASKINIGLPVAGI